MTAAAFDRGDALAERRLGALPHPRGSVKSLWVAAYCLAGVLPLAAVLVGSPPGGRGLVVELASAMGIVALTLLACSWCCRRGWGLWPARWARTWRSVCTDTWRMWWWPRSRPTWRWWWSATLQPRAVRPARSALAGEGGGGVVRGAGSADRQLAASPATAAFLCPLAGLHNVLGFGALGLGLLHAIGVDHYLTNGPSVLVEAGLVGVGVLGLVELRLLRPRRLARRPYLVERVEKERGGATTLALRADGHRGHRFRPGQFAWLKPAEALHALVEHPFSYSSSARHPERPAFTIKAYGDFTSRVPRLRPGTRLLLDGPHGSYRPRPHAERFVLIAGGIGITPLISLLRTAADTGDRRPFLLVYGSLRWEAVTFREQLERLQQRLELRVVHVLTDPPPTWTGEAGFIETDLLARHLPADLGRSEIFLCGPPPMLTAALNGLERLGVAPEHVHAEQFVTI